MPKTYKQPEVKAILSRHRDRSAMYRSAEHLGLVGSRPMTGQQMHIPHKALLHSYLGVRNTSALRNTRRNVRVRLRHRTTDTYILPHGWYLTYARKVPLSASQKRRRNLYVLPLSYSPSSVPITAPWVHSKFSGVCVVSAERSLTDNSI